jgi:hypothetical protein
MTQDIQEIQNVSGKKQYKYMQIEHNVDNIDMFIFYKISSMHFHEKDICFIIYIKAICSFEFL